MYRIKNRPGGIAMKNKIVCGYCGKVMQEGCEPISHGACDECVEKESKELDEMFKEQ